MPLTDIAVLTDTIASGQSLAAGIRADWSHVLSIGMPGAWTAAVLTFQVSQDGTTWRDLYDELGYEVSVPVAAGREVALPAVRLAAYGWLRLRSGTAAGPVNQAADRVLTLVTRRYQ